MFKRFFAMFWAILFLIGSPMSLSPHVFACGFPFEIVQRSDIYVPIDFDYTLKTEIEEEEDIPPPEPTPIPVLTSTPAPTPAAEPLYPISDYEIDLIATVVMAEAEGESEYGQCLVIDTILNRADHWAFPETVTDVIYQKNQFTCVWNGRLDRCYPKPELIELVKEELVSRTNASVVFFRTGRYSSYGTPLFKEGSHYFSSYS